MIDKFTELFGKFLDFFDFDNKPRGVRAAILAFLLFCAFLLIIPVLVLPLYCLMLVFPKWLVVLIFCLAFFWFMFYELEG